MPCLLARVLPFVILACCCGVYSAHANGVTGTIATGETKTGTVTGDGVDSYSFTFPEGGGSFVAIVSETGTHDKSFVPQISLVNPGGVAGPGSAHTLYEKIEQINAAAGNWTVKVSRMEDKGVTGGTYELSLLQVPVGASADTALTPGQSYSGSNTRGKVDVRTFNGVAGHTATVALSATGGTGFIPEATVFSPSGSKTGWVYCATSCSTDLTLPADGTYTVLMHKNDGNDVAGTYTLSVSDKN